jgi:hypothetical protein
MNALEMPDPLQPVESAEAQRNECLSLLTSLQNADGGWGFRAGGQSRVEPTCWAALSVFHSTKEQNKDDFRRLVGYLHSQQLEDGSWPASPEMKPGNWVTSLACCALSREAESEGQIRAGLNWLCQDFPRDSSPWMRFLQRVRGDSRINSQNDSYRGWGWTPRTASWVEPTSFALMALREAKAEQLPKIAINRQELALSLLYDRMCPGGGWNCGNPRVYGVDGDALVLPTCWALLALRDAPEKPERALSLAWLQKAFAKIASPGSLAVARMTLEIYGTRAPEARRNLQDWSAEELAENGTHVLAWVCMALNARRSWPGLAQQTTAGAAR